MSIFYPEANLGSKRLPSRPCEHCEEETSADLLDEDEVCAACEHETNWKLDEADDIGDIEL